MVFHDPESPFTAQGLSCKEDHQNPGPCAQSLRRQNSGEHTVTERPGAQGQLNMSFFFFISKRLGDF